MYGLANMSLFLILINYIVALMAVQMIRGDISADTTMNFGHVYNGFLAIYQIFTSENWTNLLYDITDAEIKLGQGIIITLFMVSWMLLANCEHSVSIRIWLFQSQTAPLFHSHSTADVHCGYHGEL